MKYQRLIIVACITISAIGGFALIRILRETPAQTFARRVPLVGFSHDQEKIVRSVLQRFHERCPSIEVAEPLIMLCDRTDPTLQKHMDAAAMTIENIRVPMEHAVRMLPNDIIAAGWSLDNCSVTFSDTLSVELGLQEYEKFLEWSATDGVDVILLFGMPNEAATGILKDGFPTNASVPTCSGILTHELTHVLLGNFPALQERFFHEINTINNLHHAQQGAGIATSENWVSWYAFDTTAEQREQYEAFHSRMQTTLNDGRIPTELHSFFPRFQDLVTHIWIQLITIEDAAETLTYVIDGQHYPIGPFARKKVNAAKHCLNDIHNAIEQHWTFTRSSR